MSPIRAVYFDIGETLLDRTREFAAIADVLGVPRHTFSAVFGGTVVRGGGVAQTLAHFTTESWAQVRRRAGVPPISDADMYDDVRPCLEALAPRHRLGIVGNQPADVTAELRALDLPVNTVATSTDWGVSKPSMAFFARIVADAGVEPAGIVYVGDQVDNDVVPAVAAGMLAVRITRGPWGYLVRDPARERHCLAVLPGLEELPAMLLEPAGS